MGLRFRKSVKLGPFRINFSKSGIGYSYGVKGYRVTHKADGGVRKTASIPGTGISYVTETSAKKSQNKKRAYSKPTIKEIPYESVDITADQSFVPQQKPEGRCAEISGRDGIVHYVRFIPCSACKTEILETSTYCPNCKMKYKRPKQLLDRLPVVSKLQTIKQPPEDANEPVLRSEVSAPNVEIKKLKVYPSFVDGHPLQYHYKFYFTAVENIDIANDVLQGEEKIVDVAPNGDCIDLIYSGFVFGKIHDPRKAEMLYDWNRKQLPANAVLFASGTEVSLRFYEDKRIRNAWREQDVFALVNFKGEEAQDMIGLLHEGEQLDYEKDYDLTDDQTVCVLSCGTVIGKFPKKYAEKASEKDIVFIFVEKVEYDEFYKPYVRVFW